MSLAPLVCLYTVETPLPTRLWPQSPPLAPVAHPSASSSPCCTQLCLQVSGQHLPITGVGTEAPPQRGPPWSPVPITLLYVRLLRLLKSSDIFVCLPVCYASCPIGNVPCGVRAQVHLVHVRRPEAQCEGTSDDPLLCTKLMFCFNSLPRSDVPWSRDIYSFKAFDRQHQVNGI